jgi:hypothetical protein
MKDFIKQAVESEDFAIAYDDFCRHFFFENNMTYNYGTFIIQENRENGREKFLVKSYPNVKDNTEKDYYIKLMKLGIIRYLSSIIGEKKIPKSLRNNFIEFKD